MTYKYIIELDQLFKWDELRVAFWHDGLDFDEIRNKIDVRGTLDKAAFDLKQSSHVKRSLAWQIGQFLLDTATPEEAELFERALCESTDCCRDLARELFSVLFHVRHKSQSG